MLTHAEGEDEKGVEAPFTDAELEAALAMGETGKSPGLDEVYLEMRLALTPALRRQLLSLYNQSWRQRLAPAIWKLGCIIPILKDDKPEDLPASYRPVSLTSVIAKVMERLVVNRLTYILEKYQLLPDEQYGYRAGRSTTAATTLISEIIGEGFKCTMGTHHRTMMACVDLSKAFDTVVWDKLAEAMREMRIPPVFIGWFKSFLSDRFYRVRVNGTLSSAIRYFNGFPQGSVSSPILWNIYAHSVTKALKPTVAQVQKLADRRWTTMERKLQKQNLTRHNPLPRVPGMGPRRNRRTEARVAEGNKASDVTLAIRGHHPMQVLFADDLNFIISGPDPKILRRFLQLVLKRVEGRLNHLALTVSGPKLQAILFQKEATHDDSWMHLPELKIAHHKIPWTKVVRFLGVQYSSNATQKEQALSVHRKASPRLKQLRAVATREWGASLPTLRQAYLGYILSVLTYAAPSWWPRAAEGHRNRIRALHHEGARIITGCIASTDLNSLLLEADLYPLDHYMDMAAVVELEKWRRMPPCTLMHKVAMGPRRPSQVLKTPQWQDEAERILQEAGLAAFKAHVAGRPNAAAAATPIYPRSSTGIHPLVPPWDTGFVNQVHITSSLQGVDKNKGAEEQKAEKLRICREALQEPSLAATQLKTYTDASVDVQHPKQGAGAYVYLRDGEELHPRLTSTLNAGKLCYSMRAEAQTLNAAVKATTRAANVPDKAFLTDSASSLASLAKGPIVRQRHSALAMIWPTLRQMMSHPEERLRTRSVHFQFVYAHCGLPGNEFIDRQAGDMLGAIKAGRAGRVNEMDAMQMQSISIDIESVKAEMRHHLLGKWKMRMQRSHEDRLAAGRQPFPRFAMEAGGTAATPRTDLNKFSRRDAVVIRQLRTGETRLAGKYHTRLSREPERVKCRWCLLNGTAPAEAPRETIGHLFDACANPQVQELRLARPPGAPPAPRVCADTLFNDPARALTFYRACLGLIPPPPEIVAAEAPQRGNDV